MRMILIVLFFPLLSFATNQDESTRQSTRDCGMALGAVTMDEYIRAVQGTEVTPASLQRAEDEMVNALVDFTFFPTVGPDVARDPSALLDAIVRPYSGALGARIRGLQRLSDDFAEDMAVQIERFTGVRTDLAALRRDIARTAVRPEIERPFAMAEFVMRKRPSLEAFFLQATEVYPGGMFLMGGPRQAEMVRLALQYGHTKPGDRILEIGYGSPAVLLGLRDYSSASHLVGVDPTSPLAIQENWLLQRDVRLVRGIFSEGPTFRDLRKQGPYQVIVALDTISVHPGNLRTNAEPSRFVHLLRGLLAPSGMLIILNDFDAAPNFTCEQAEAAGFEVVRWGAVRDLPPEVRRIMPYQPYDLDGGRMRGFVLRNGPEDISRTEVRASSRN